MGVVNLPEGWNSKQIGDLTTCTAGGTPSTRNPSYWDGDIPWMNSGELNHKQVHAVEGRITSEGLANSSTKMIPINSVLIGLAGQGKTRGTVAINRIPLCTNQSIAAVFPNESFDSDYLFYNLENRYSELRELSDGGGGRGGLNLSIINKLEIPLPALAEQKAIAAALSDIDDLILLIEKEIYKKQNLKLAMSESLFSKVYSEIVHLRLRDIGFFYGGLSGKSGQDFRKGNSKYITFLNVINNVIADPNMIETVDIKSNEKQNLVLAGDLLFNGSSETPEEVAFPSLVPSALNGFHLNSFCFGFRFEKTDSLDPLFFAHYLRSRFGRQFVSQLAQGSTRYNISKNALYDLVWDLPPISTQIEIGKILSDLDSDLSELKKEKSKYEWIKKGMMNDLLTGKVRLV